MTTETTFPGDQAGPLAGGASGGAADGVAAGRPGGPSGGGPSGGRPSGGGSLDVGRVEVSDTWAAVALEHAQAALDDLFAAGVKPDSHVDAVVWIDELERLGRRVDAARSALVGAIQNGRWYMSDGHGSARIMVRHVARLSEAESLARSKTAAACMGLVEVEAAWQAGEVSTCAVRVLGRARSNPRIAEAMAARQGEFLADAKAMGNRTFARKVYRWARLIDEDGPEPANERNHNSRDARLRPNPWDLSWDFSGFFASAQGAAMREIFDRYVDAELQADWAEAKTRLGHNSTTDAAANGTGTGTGADGPGTNGSGPYGEVTKADLRRTDAQRRADALFRIFQDAAASPDGAVPPGFVHNIHWSEAAYQEMLAAMDADRAPSFDPDTFMCRTDDGYDLDPCEAAANSLFNRFRRLVVDAAGVVIDLGRARRFTGSARIAATATHPHCIWPGCHAPSSACDVDHLHEHGRGGTTDPANGAPLCGRHNRWKQKGFTIRRMPDGTWNTTRPDGSQLE